MVQHQRPVTMGSEEALAARVQYERKRKRDWTYEALADHMERVGCKIHPSALHRIENKQRAVKVNELIALSNVFGARISDLLLPLDLILDREGRKKVERWGATEAVLLESQDARDDAWWAVIQHLKDHPESEPHMRAAVADYHRKLGETAESAEAIAKSTIDEALDPKWSLSTRWRLRHRKEVD